MFYRSLDEHIIDDSRPPPARHPDKDHEFNVDPDAYIEKYKEWKFNNYNINEQEKD